MVSNSTNANFQQPMSSYLIPLFSLSYQENTPTILDSFQGSSFYGSGLLDLCLITTIIAIMAVLRDAFRLGFFEPLARWVLSKKLARLMQPTKINGSAKPIANSNGHSHDSSYVKKEQRRAHRSVLRFAEQGWSFVYYSLQWGFGFYVNWKLPTRSIDSATLFSGYPHFPLPGPVKLYYLMQFAFYLHQILILNAEQRRKDHVQMMAHHVITIVLMALSYSMNFTRVGCLVMVLMDWCDIFLPLAKMIRYLRISQMACDWTFGFFLVSWFITRHVLFVLVIKALYDAATDQDVTVFIWNPEADIYVNVHVWFCFCALLMSLQILQLGWFWMICRVAWRVVSGQGATDERSDDEGDDKED